MKAPHRLEPEWDGRRWTGTYAAYLKTEWWAIVREWVLRIGRFTCRDCGWRQGDQGTLWLEVHHLTYERLGDEVFGDLAVLCCRCHAVRHGRKEPVGFGPVPIARLVESVIANVIAVNQAALARRTRSPAEVV